MDWVKRHQELVLQKFRNEQVFMPPSMENELKAIQALLDTQEENQALTAENRELRELVGEAEKIIKDAMNAPPCFHGGRIIQRGKATALLPRLEKAGKEAPKVSENCPKCPRCGEDAHPHDLAYFGHCRNCGKGENSIPPGTLFDSDSTAGGETDKDRQISALTEKLEAWRGLKQTLDYANTEARCDRITAFIEAEHIDRLRALGEIE